MKNIVRKVFFVILFFYFIGCTYENPTVSINTSATNTLTPDDLISFTPNSPTEGDPMDVLVTLLRDNGDCEFPCLLGVSAEIDSVNMLDIFKKFSNSSSTGNDDVQVFVDEKSRSLLVTSKIDEDSWESIFFSQIIVNEHDQDIKILHLETQNDTSFEIDFTDKTGLSISSYYSLSSILRQYGMPSEVLIAPFPVDPNYPEESYPFSTILFYEKHNALLQYVSDRRGIEGNYLGCQPTTYIDIVTWSTSKTVSISEAVNYLSGIGANSLNIKYFKNIDTVTSYSLVDFYTKFSDNSEKCIETPKTYWDD